MDLGNPDLVFGSINAAVVSTYLQGLALPNYMFGQVINMIYRTGLSSGELMCHSLDGNLGNCTIPMSCSDFAPLADLSFRLQFGDS